MSFVVSLLLHAGLVAVVASLAVGPPTLRPLEVFSVPMTAATPGPRDDKPKAPAKPKAPHARRPSRTVRHVPDLPPRVRPPRVAAVPLPLAPPPPRPDRAATLVTAHIRPSEPPAPRIEPVTSPAPQPEPPAPSSELPSLATTVTGDAEDASLGSAPLEALSDPGQTPVSPPPTVVVADRVPASRVTPEDPLPTAPLDQAPAATAPVTGERPAVASVLRPAPALTERPTVVPPRTQLAGAPVPHGAQEGAALGLGLGHLRIALDGEKERVTEHPVETVTGRIVGRKAPKVLVRVGDVVQEAAVEGEAFSAGVPLSPGLNHIRLFATDAQGATAEESLTVAYTPPPPTDTIAITSPTDGSVLPVDAPPVVIVEGRIDDPKAERVRIVVNDQTVSAPIVDGRFRQAVPMLATAVRIYAEVATDGGAHRSREVTVHTAATTLSDAVLVLDQAESDTPVGRVSVAWRANPDRVDVKPRPVSLRTVSLGAATVSTRVFYLQNPAPGAYTLTVRFGTVGESRLFGGTLYLPSGSTLRPRPLRTVPVTAGGTAVVARVLLPQGVLWEEDAWFTGQSTAADTITKFRFPEGIAWTERKATLAR